MKRAAWQAGGSRQAFPASHRLDRFLGTRLGVEADRHADRVAVLYRYTVGVRAHLERRVRDHIITVCAEQLEHFALELRLLVGDVGDDVAEDVERCYARI